MDQKGAFSGVLAVQRDTSLNPMGIIWGPSIFTSRGASTPFLLFVEVPVHLEFPAARGEHLRPGAVFQDLADGGVVGPLQGKPHPVAAVLTIPPPDLTSAANALYLEPR